MVLLLLISLATSPDRKRPLKDCRKAFIAVVTVQESTNTKTILSEDSVRRQPPRKLELLELLRSSIDLNRSELNTPVVFAPKRHASFPFSCSRST